MLNHVMELLFPQSQCIICRRDGDFLPHQPWCRDCHAQLKQLAASGPVCEHCGRYIESPGLCRDCNEDPPEFTVARAVGPYEQNFRMAVKIYKFMGRRKMAWPMARMMVRRMRQDPAFNATQLLVGVPISKNSLFERGFNQTELLARQMSRQSGLPFKAQVIARVREGAPQRELSRQARAENLKDAFTVQHPRMVKDKHVVLVDDVYTTGSTARECTRVLLAAGAASVNVITWATARA